MQNSENPSTRASRPSRGPASSTVPAWGALTFAVLVFALGFAHWGSIPIRSLSGVGELTPGFPPLFVGMQLDATAWNATALGLPCWFALVLAAVYAVGAFVRGQGHDVPRALLIVLLVLGALHPLAFFSALTSGGGTPGIGAFATVVAFGTMLFFELRTAQRDAPRRRRSHRVASEPLPFDSFSDV